MQNTVLLQGPAAAAATAFFQWQATFHDLQPQFVVLSLLYNNENLQQELQNGS